MQIRVDNSVYKIDYRCACAADVVPYSDSGIPGLFDIICICQTHGYSINLSRQNKVDVFDACRYFNNMDSSQDNGVCILHKDKENVEYLHKAFKRNVLATHLLNVLHVIGIFSWIYLGQLLCRHAGLGWFNFCGVLLILQTCFLISDFCNRIRSKV